MVILGFLAFIVLLFVFYLTMVKKSSTVKTTTTKIVPTMVVTKYKGFLELTPAKTDYKIGEMITVKVLASSDSQSISGFDLVVNYDPTKIKYMSNSLLDKDFQAIVKDKKGVLKITAYKINDNAKNKVFDKTDLVDLNFAAIKASTANLSLMFAKNQTNDTNLLNDQNEDVLTRVTSTAVSIK